MSNDRVGFRLMDIPKMAYEGGSDIAVT